MKKKSYIWSEIRHGTLAGKKACSGLIFVAPWIIGAAIFFIYPLFNTLWLSVHEIFNWKTMERDFVGLKWYIDTVTADINFLPRMFKVSFQNLINLPFLNIFALIIAIMLNRDIRARGLYRTLFFLPVLLGNGFIMQQLLGQNIDGETISFASRVILTDSVMEYIGPKGTELVNSFLNNITTILWSSGLNIVIYLSGLQSISPHIYEAARVDSASEWEIFWLITLPMMAPMIQLNLVFTVIYTFSMADNDMLEFIDFLAFNSTERAAYEYSSAVAWIYTVFILLIVGAIFLLTRRSVNNVKEGAA